MLKISPDKPRIYRLTHFKNFNWIIGNGLHCRNSNAQDPDFQVIGNQEIIDERANRPVPIEPGGTLGDYVPFYFTPFTPMYQNIYTGYRNIPQVPKDDLFFIVANLSDLTARSIRWVFSDRHAKLDYANFSGNLTDLVHLDWACLQARDYKRDVDKPEKFERYQAEALIHKHLPLDAFSGLICHSPETKEKLELILAARNVPLQVSCQTEL
jgi:hypothetical protein